MTCAFGSAVPVVEDLMSHAYSVYFMCFVLLIMILMNYPVYIGELNIRIE